MEKEVIVAEGAPRAIGVYSQGIRANGLLFISGQIPADPQTGQIVNGDIQKQTTRALQNLKAVVEGASLTLRNVVRVGVFLKDMDDFEAMNEVFAEFFTEKPPARSCVEVSRLPKGVSIEVDAIAAF